MAGKNGGRRPNTGGRREGAGRKMLSHNLLNVELRKLIIAHVGPEKIFEVIDKMVELSLDGNVRMIEVLFNRIYGKPSETINLNAEVKHIRDTAKSTLKDKLLKLKESATTSPELLN